MCGVIGGIRCELASAHLMSLGVQDISQLNGGIHRYLEQFPSDQGGFFRGKNMVFDARGTQSKVKTVEDVSSAQDRDTDSGRSREGNSETEAESGVGVEGEILGQCYRCRTPTDTLSADRVCTVCLLPSLSLSLSFSLLDVRYVSCS